MPENLVEKQVRGFINMINNEEFDEYNVIKMDDGGLNPLDISRLESVKNLLKNNKINIITGNNRAFSAGANINNFVGMKDTEAFNLSMKGHEILDEIESFPMPVISVLNGYTLGGGLELALSTDFRIGGPKLKWGFPEVNLGILPGWGGTQRLKKLAGRANSEYIIMTGKTFNADDAVRYGIIAEISDNPMERAIELAVDLYKKSREAIINIKKLMMESSFYDESKYFAELFNTKNAKMGIESFLNKKTPKFNE
ncbi:hypothetical protein SE19_03265 [Acidiplasma aeolicum]|uniref:Enoyl-CoA hydratase n=3 Tax=Ferroplasmaceae TaxID=90142 RepID=A0A0Q0RVU6_9ARCH|nr:hypothetical protein SE19_03265 [Acidiplasma aeolicum]KQB36509.1 hypothetical protein AOG55_03850 [Acidiplasma cupricumulans]